MFHTIRWFDCCRRGRNPNDGKGLLDHSLDERTHDIESAVIRPWLLGELPKSAMEIHRRVTMALGRSSEIYTLLFTRASD